MSVEDYRDPPVDSPTSNKPKTVGVFTIDVGEMSHRSVSHEGNGLDGGHMKDDQASSCSTCGGFIGSMTESIRLSLGDTKIVVHLLVIVFAIASWADFNAMWSEMPLLTLTAPEQWTLASYVIIISQVANVGPVLFVVASYFLPKTRPQLEISVSFVVIIISMVAAFLMGYFYDYTSHIAGEERSTGLLLLNFFLAVGDCTSSVCFYAFMSLMKPQYIASLLLGEGLSGFLPGMLALIQGAGEITCVNGSSVVNETFPNGTIHEVIEYSVYPQYEQPRFSVRAYFIIVSVMIALSGVAFVILIKWSYCRSEFVRQKDQRLTVPGSDDEGEEGTRGRQPSYGSTEEQAIHVNGDSSSKTSGLESFSGPVQDGHLSGDDQVSSSREVLQGSSELLFRHNMKSRLRSTLKSLIYLENLSGAKFFWLLLIVFVVNATLTTFLSSIQTFTILPYGLEYYHLTTSLGQMANPAACFFALFVLAEKLWIISVITVLGQGIVAYLIYLAAESPHPPMEDQSGGGEIAVCLWISVTLLLIYAKVCVASVLRKCGGRSALVWAGFITQVGTSVGAIVGFLLVNQYHVFKDAPYC